MALDLFPFNVEALLNTASKQFAAGASRGALDVLEKQAVRLLSFNAGDARLYSLLGELEMRKASPDTAMAAFEKALALARTEIHASQRVLFHAVESGNTADILDRLDALFRRWPDRIAAYAPLIPQVFSQPEQYEMLVRRVNARPPWTSTLISKLADNEETLPFSAQLIQDLAATAFPLRLEDISNVTNGLINAQQYDLAYRTFFLTLSPKQQDLMGYVYNGRFRSAPTGRPFDWQIRSHPGVVFSYPATENDASTHGLALEFQQAPVRDLQVRQYLLLPAGHYSLSLRASAVAARLPKGLFWNVRCVDSNARLAQIPLKDGTYRDIAFKADITVPPTRCPLQSLHLSTSALSESWNDRYGGTMVFDDIEITERSQ